MKTFLHRLAGGFLARTGLHRCPVRVRSGIAVGARWTLHPFSSYWRGTHEPAVQSLLMELGGGDIQGWNCWDIGAHFGLYSIGLARRVGPTGQVAAFEPNPRSYTRLRLHADMNPMPWLKTFQVAASDQSGAAEFLTYGDLGNTTTHLAYEGERLTPAAQALAITSLRLDSLVDRGELRLPNFIKIDVEGHGHRALAGMASTLVAARPIIVAAMHSPQEVEGTFSQLGRLGYNHTVVGPTPESASKVGFDFLFTPAG